MRAILVETELHHILFKDLIFIGVSFFCMNKASSQPPSTCSNSTIETPKQYVKSIQSEQERRRRSCVFVLQLFHT